MKKDFVMPILVLTVICLVTALALAVTGSFTQPVIKAAADERAELARREIIPEASGFEPVETDGLPASVTGVYGTTNDVGYIFVLEATGFGGEIELMCGIGGDGTIIACKVLSQNETKGLGAKIEEPAFNAQFAGKDSALEGVSAISRATITSKAYLRAIEDAFAAYEIVRGTGG